MCRLGSSYVLRAPASSKPGCNSCHQAEKPPLDRGYKTREEQKIRTRTVQFALCLVSFDKVDFEFRGWHSELSSSRKRTTRSEAPHRRQTRAIRETARDLSDVQSSEGAIEDLETRSLKMKMDSNFLASQPRGTFRGNTPRGLSILCGRLTPKINSPFCRNFTLLNSLTW